MLWVSCLFATQTGKVLGAWDRLSAQPTHALLVLLVCSLCEHAGPISQLGSTMASQQSSSECFCNGLAAICIPKPTCTPHPARTQMPWALFQVGKWCKHPFCFNWLVEKRQRAEPLSRRRVQAHVGTAAVRLGRRGYRIPMLGLGCFSPQVPVLQAGLIQLGRFVFGCKADWSSGSRTVTDC